jgi:hypothetical protein
VGVHRAAILAVKDVTDVTAVIAIVNVDPAIDRVAKTKE